MQTLHVYRNDERGMLISNHSDFASEYRFLDSVRYTHAQLSQAAAIWLSETEGFKDIEDLLLGVVRKGKLFVETQFLSLAQALEGFHRATGSEVEMDKAQFKMLRKSIADFLVQENVDEEIADRVNTAVSFSNQTSFRSRLTELCGRVSADTLGRMKIKKNDFAKDVVKARNFYTHAGSTRKGRKKPLNFDELFFLSQKMRALLRAVFLLHLGFPQDQIQELVVRDANRWV